MAKWPRARRIESGKMQFPLWSAPKNQQKSKLKQKPKRLK